MVENCSGGTALGYDWEDGANCVQYPARLGRRSSHPGKWLVPSAAPVPHEYEIRCPIELLAG